MTRIGGGKPPVERAPPSRRSLPFSVGRFFRMPYPDLRAARDMPVPCPKVPALSDPIPGARRLPAEMTWLRGIRGLTLPPPPPLSAAADCISAPPPSDGRCSRSGL